MKLKKRTRKIVLISVGILVSLFIIKTILFNVNFEKDQQILLELKSKAGAGELTYVLNELEKIESLSNPPMNFAYKKWKENMYSRFILDNETIENTSDNKIINDVSSIYRKYWRTELLKENPKERTDSLLYDNLTNYLLTNNLTELSKDSLRKSIQNDSELKRIIENEGFKVDFKFRNGFQELFIWNKETILNYNVVLPKDTISTQVVFIESYHINGYDNYATVGSSQVGGWAIKESATLYCNKGVYDIDSENFKISYLKHESLHFTDLNEYPNLSSADLEYRAKVVELMYCTEETVYDRINDFITSANKSNRSHSHPYANYVLIENLSKIVFSSEYNSTIEDWRKIPAEKINNAAADLFLDSESTLLNNKSIKEVI